MVDTTSSMVAFNKRSFQQLLQEKGIAVQLLQNQRTSGASGAWNTALHAILRQQLSSFNSVLASSEMNGKGSSSSSWSRPSQHDVDPSSITYIAILGE